MLRENQSCTNAKRVQPLQAENGPLSAQPYPEKENLFLTSLATWEFNVCLRWLSSFYSQRQHLPVGNLKRNPGYRTLNKNTNVSLWGVCLISGTTQGMQVTLNLTKKERFQETEILRWVLFSLSRYLTLNMSTSFANISRCLFLLKRYKNWQICVAK